MIDCRHSDAGFTLIEMVVAIVLVGLLATLGGLLMGKAFDAYVGSRDVVAVAVPGQTALEQMVREVRQVRSQTLSDIPVWSSTVFEFYDTSGRFIRYSLSGNQLMLSTDGGATETPMATGVSGLAFTYTGTNGQVLVPTVGQEGNIKEVTIAFTAASGSVQRSYQVTVTPRMFQ